MRPADYPRLLRVLPARPWTYRRVARQDAVSDERRRRRQTRLPVDGSGIAWRRDDVDGRTPDSQNEQVWHVGPFPPHKNSMRRAVSGKPVCQPRDTNAQS